MQNRPASQSTGLVTTCSIVGLGRSLARSPRVMTVIVAVTLGGKWCYQILVSSVNSDAYINFLQSMHKKFVHQWHSLPWKNTVLIHDNARPHVSLQKQNFFWVKNVTLWKQPPYSPDFNLLDRWIFSYKEIILTSTIRTILMTSFIQPLIPSQNLIFKRNAIDSNWI